jgi:hypothetical protein
MPEGETDQVPFPPGHYYSPYASEVDVERASARAWAPVPESLPGIDLAVEDQLALLRTLAELREPDEEFPQEPAPDRRFHVQGSPYPVTDALVLSLMMRHLRPARIVEVGSGYSSALMLDVNERFLDGRATLTVIDPYPERMLALLRPGDPRVLSLMRSPVQDVPISVFDELEAGDILFIDSTHVSKAGSDVNHLVFEVFPRLVNDVYIHVHDIAYPFEYIPEWVLENRWAFSEAYLLRAFLEHNADFGIRFFSTYLGFHHRAELAETLPELLEPSASVWISRLRGGNGR